MTISSSRHSILGTTSLLVVLSVAAQTAPTPPRSLAPLGLLRLAEPNSPVDASKLAATKFAIDSLSVSGTPGASKALRGGVNTLILDTGKEYSCPLRGTGRQTTFVSFQVYGSQTTIIEVGGAV